MKLKYLQTDLAGEQFGDWIVICIDSLTKDKHKMWLCSCKNGHLKSILGTNLTRNFSKKCEKCKEKTSKFL